MLAEEFPFRSGSCGLGLQAGALEHLLLVLGLPLGLTLESRFQVLEGGMTRGRSVESMSSPKRASRYGLKID